MGRSGAQGPERGDLTPGRWPRPLVACPNSQDGQNYSMLALRNLEVVYSDVILVLRGISIEVPEGKIVALLGANGAGKTTTLRAISGLLDVHNGDITKGDIEVDGNRVTNLPAPQLVNLGISQVLEGRRILGELTVEENLRLGAHTSHRSQVDNLGRVYSLFPKLAERTRSTAGYLSGGEQQMLAIGRALMSSPRYLLLDEPSLGLAPLLVQQIRDIVVEINRQGTGVLLVEQNARMALSIADHGYIMENGNIVMDKPARELLQDDDVREFYLGLHGEEIASFATVKHYRRKKRWLS